MTRLAYVCADDGAPVFGMKGCSVHAQEVIRALRGRGASVCLFAAKTGGEAPEDLRDLEVIRLPSVAAEKADAAGREAGALWRNQAVGKLLEEHGPFDVIYERYSLWNFAAMVFAQAQGIPGLLEVNAPLIEEQVKHRELAHREAAEAATAWAFGSASALLAVSDEVAAWVRGRGARSSLVHVVPNGVNVERFAESQIKRRMRQAQPVTAGFIGTLKPWHGTEALLEAFASLRRQGCGGRLLIVGDGPERGRLEHRGAALGLGDSVTFTGAVAPRLAPDVLAAMDIGVAPYPPMEGFYFSPLKVYEYMAAGLPVIASEVGQLRRLITHDHDGWLVEPGQPARLAEALQRLFEDAGLRGRLGRAARETVERHHTWAAVADRILQLAGAAREHKPPRRRAEVKAKVMNR